MKKVLILVSESVKRKLLESHDYDPKTLALATELDVDVSNIETTNKPNMYF